MDKTRSRFLRGYPSARGEFLVSIFIQQPIVHSCQFLVVCATVVGDGRGFRSVPDCVRSRACIRISFGLATVVSVRVNHSRGKVDMLPEPIHPSPAFPIVWQMPPADRSANGVVATRMQSMFKVSWNLKNSITPALHGTPAIDGSLRLLLPTRSNPSWTYVLENDKYPSLQLYFRSGPRRSWRAIGRMTEIDPGELADGPDAAIHGRVR
jgi:hypothetical protein